MNDILSTYLKKKKKKTKAHRPDLKPLSTYFKNRNKAMSDIDPSF